MIIEIKVVIHCLTSSFSLSLFSISLNFILMAIEVVALVSGSHGSVFALIWLLVNESESFDDAFSREFKT